MLTIVIKAGVYYFIILSEGLKDQGLGNIDLLWCLIFVTNIRGIDFKKIIKIE